MPGVINVFRQGKSRVQLGENKNLFDYTYVENIVHAHVLAALLMTKDRKDICGQAFNITNDQPIPFWDFMSIVWRQIDPSVQTLQIHLPVWFAIFIGFLCELISFLVSPFFKFEPTLTRFRVTLATTHRWYNIEKAKKVLGYKPIVELKEGIKKSVDAFLMAENNSNQTKKKEN